MFGRSLTEIHRILAVESDVNLLAQIIEVRDNSFCDPNVRTVSRRAGVSVTTGAIDMSARSVRRQMRVIYGRRDGHRTSASRVCVAQVVRQLMQFVGTEFVLIVEHCRVRTEQNSYSEGTAHNHTYRSSAPDDWFPEWLRESTGRNQSLSGGRQRCRL